jgi:hypothetical protein
LSTLFKNGAQSGGNEQSSKRKDPSITASNPNEGLTRSAQFQVGKS